MVVRCCSESGEARAAQRSPPALGFVPRDMGGAGCVASAQDAAATTDLRRGAPFFRFLPLHGGEAWGEALTREGTSQRKPEEGDSSEEAKGFDIQESQDT